MSESISSEKYLVKTQPNKDIELGADENNVALNGIIPDEVDLKNAQKINSSPLVDLTALNDSDRQAVNEVPETNIDALKQDIVPLKESDFNSFTATEKIYQVNVVDENIGYDPLTIIPILLIFIGWVVIYNNAKKLSTRAETKALIDDAVKMLGELDSNVMSYWLSSGSKVTGVREFELLFNSKLNILNDRINLIYSRGLNCNDLNLSALSRLALIDSELAKKRSKELNAIQVQMYLNESSKLVSLLYEKFQNLYKPSLTPPAS